MKKETKMLIRWAEEHFRLYQISVHTHPEKHGLNACGVDMEFNNSADFLHFLKTLPEIEKKLCFGGYIQDRNGTPCCHGDTVKILTPSGQPADTGTLCWNATNHHFYIMNRSFGTSLWGFSKEQIEKIEK